MAKKKEPTASFAVRLSKTLRQKLSWFAAERGVEMAEAARLLIYDGTKDAKPPADAQSREFQASDAEWRAWEALAAKYDSTADALLRHVANLYVAKELGAAPQMRNGVMHWNPPADAA